MKNYGTYPSSKRFNLLLFSAINFNNTTVLRGFPRIDIDKPYLLNKRNITTSSSADANPIHKTTLSKKKRNSAILTVLVKQSTKDPSFAELPISLRSVENISGILELALIKLKL